MCRAACSPCDGSRTVSSKFTTRCNKRLGDVSKTYLTENALLRRAARPPARVPAVIGMESTGNCQWFVEMVTTLGHAVWVGDAAKIRASEVRQQKHDRRDAALILKLLREGRFPCIWTPSGEEKDLRQLLIHGYKVLRIRARVQK